MSRYPTGLRRFTLVSHDVGDGSKFDTAQLSGLLGAGGDDISPHLRWQGAPTPTLSYAVTMFDEHGLGDSGFWHWIVVDIPPGMTELRADAGHPSGRGLPNCARQLPNDLKLGRYIGAAPPLGDWPHTYRLSVHALDVARLDISDDGTPARLLWQLYRHAIGRASITVTCEHPQLASSNARGSITVKGPSLIQNRWLPTRGFRRNAAAGGATLIFIVVRFETKPEWTDRWPELVAAFTEATRAEEGNLWFDWSRSLDDPAEYVLVEAFRDAEAGSAHVSSDHFKTAMHELPQALATPRIISQTLDATGWSEMAEMSVA